MPSNHHGHRKYQLRLVRDDDLSHPISFWLDVRKASKEHRNCTLCPNSCGKMYETIQGTDFDYRGVLPCKWGPVAKPQATYVLRADKEGVPTELELLLDFRAQERTTLDNVRTQHLLRCVIPTTAFPRNAGEGALRIQGEFTTANKKKMGINYTFDIHFIEEESNADDMECGYKPGEQGFGSVIRIL